MLFFDDCRKGFTRTVSACGGSRDGRARVGEVGGGAIDLGVALEPALLGGALAPGARVVLCGEVRHEDVEPLELPLQLVRVFAQPLN